MYHFQPVENKMRFPDPLGPTSEIKTRSLVQLFLFIAFEEVKYNCLYLRKLLPKLLFISHVVHNSIRTIAHASI